MLYPYFYALICNERSSPNKSNDELVDPEAEGEHVEEEVEGVAVDAPHLLRHQVVDQHCVQVEEGDEEEAVEAIDRHELVDERLDIAQCNLGACHPAPHLTHL